MYSEFERCYFLCIYLFLLPWIELTIQPECAQSAHSWVLIITHGKQSILINFEAFVAFSSVWNVIHMPHHGKTFFSTKTQHKAVVCEHVCMLKHTTFKIQHKRAQYKLRAVVTCVKYLFLSLRALFGSRIIK